ncbi:MAG: ATP-dependent zinc metalloprotease FtsH [Clostridiales bacterium]|jgi:cell division protease FtsH|nr:ATP-dependent zinc metalloprotease FtsH [Clostridiales bacterium]MDR2750720.1 ATP-dependent zinc metalloprotease FtsH [Clostridiales bacterium]
MSSIILYIIILGFILAVVTVVQNSASRTEAPQYTYSDLVKDLESGRVSKIDVIRDSDISNAGRATVSVIGDATIAARVVEIPSIDIFMQLITEKAAEVQLNVDTKQTAKTSYLVQLIPMIIIAVISIFLLLFMVQQMQGGSGGNRIMSFGKSKARVVMDDKKKITFEQVAGLIEEKAELEEIVEFLKAPKKFTDIGARIPKGVLLIGPPGTGKTYLAKAVSGEARVPFFSISGSDFVEMFVGVGASRVRDLFDQAKKNTPCIVFIDEIDAVGRRRGAGLGGGHDEREQTLNQLLVEMDGFGLNEGVIIMAATNRPDILDPALLRPGRFDRQIVVGKPDVKGRESVLAIHAKTKVIAKNVDFKVVAQTTSGFTPADLENLLNEAALLAARHDKKEIDMDDLRKAFVKVGIGTEKKSRVISEKERRITAYHEAGHAILFEVLSEIDPTYMVSVIPTGMVGGYTMALPGEDMGYITKRFMEQTIVSLLGGRAAEAIVLKDVTTGAANDIERATGIARSMVMKYGMSDELGPIQFGDDNDEVFIGRDLAHTRNYGESVASKIDAEIKKIVEDGYSEALRIINQHLDILHQIAQLLLEKEKVTGEEIRKLFPIGSLKGGITDGGFLAT